MRCIALVVAAGRGSRIGGEIPKQYLTIGGSTVLARSLAAFIHPPGVDAVACVIHPDDRDLYDRATSGLTLLPPVHGGASRQDSVRLGLQSLKAEAPDVVLIHDAARPFVDSALISRTLAALSSHPGALPAVPVVDTLKRGIHGLVGETVDRAGLWRAQTPQGFRFSEILAAHEVAAGLELTDDVAVAERAGLSVALVEGAEDNFKITTAADVRRAEFMLGSSEMRTGQGFDVHRFTEGDQVMLCGVAVPHTHALAGHSDADVALHALTDALLGAVCAGDIGTHFPPSEPRWKGENSATFARHAVQTVRAAGGTLLHVDVTIICEAPKVGPHRPAMVARLAEILDLAPERISVKATTTEGLGFTGRKEGIAAQAIATVQMG